MTTPANQVFVSAATAWEIEIKKRSGKLDFPTTVIHEAATSDFTVLAISGEEASLAGALDWDHKDPFDRLLAAQALENGLVLLSGDEALLTAPGIRTLAP